MFYVRPLRHVAYLSVVCFLYTALLLFICMFRTNIQLAPTYEPLGICTHTSEFEHCSHSNSWLLEEQDLS